MEWHRHREVRDRAVGTGDAGTEAGATKKLGTVSEAPFEHLNQLSHRDFGVAHG
jgi:hypothetical protein